MSGQDPPSSSVSPTRSPWPDSEDPDGWIERKIWSALPRLTSAVVSLARRGDEDDTPEADSWLSEIVQTLQKIPLGGNYSEVVELASGLCELEQRWKEDRKALAKARELPEPRDTSDDESGDPGARVPAVSVVRLQSEMQMLKNEAKDLRARNESLEESLSESLEIIVQIRCMPPFGLATTLSAFRTAAAGTHAVRAPPRRFWDPHAKARQPYAWWDAPPLAGGLQQDAVLLQQYAALATSGRLTACRVLRLQRAG